MTASIDGDLLDLKALIMVGFHGPEGNRALGIVQRLLEIDMFTKAEIELWLNAEGKRAAATDWAESYKFGFTQGLVAVMARMDDDLKRTRASAAV